MAIAILKIEHNFLMHLQFTGKEGIDFCNSKSHVNDNSYFGSYFILRTIMFLCTYQKL